MADARHHSAPADDPAARLDASYRDALYGAYVTTHAGTIDAKTRGAVAGHFRRHILPHLPERRDARICDVACGSGELLALLSADGYAACEGVDRSGEQVRAARAAGVAGVTEGDAFSFLSSRAGEFDAIVAVDFLEHLVKAEVIEFLRIARRALRPGGHLVVQTCNGASPMFGRIRYGDFTHETAFTDRSIAQVFLAAGLSPVGVYGIDPVAHGARSLVRAVAWRAIKIAAMGYLAAETGVLRGHILSQNLIAVATRDDRVRSVP
jgi:2-polyprenyl-3-methyl-5-hydroxy-6-metoxy-1,4-benzoquinol methylase